MSVSSLVIDVDGLLFVLNCRSLFVGANRTDLTGVGGDGFVAERNITWTGWRLLGVKLSDFTQNAAGALGPGRILPGAIKQFNIAVHSAGVPGNEVEMYVDFICFTYGKPFNQSN